MASQAPAPAAAEAASEGDDATKSAISRVVKARAGIYTDKAAHPEFAKVVLVTAANSAYMDFYRNWECAAKRFGLDWAVIANDDGAAKQVTAERALPVMGLGTKVSDMVGWGNIKLDFIGRNKLEIAAHIITATGLDVIFTDSDNMFLQDPFRAGISLGDLIRTRKYDYIYQPELNKRPPDGYKSPGDGGNTGFWYASARKPAKLAKFFRLVMSRVDERLAEGHGCADQPKWWQTWNEMRKGKQPELFGFKCARMCGQKPTCETDSEDTIEYCGMDPRVHATGWENAGKWKGELATYHANYAAGPAKIGKLKDVGMWDLWDKSAGECKT